MGEQQLRTWPAVDASGLTSGDLSMHRIVELRRGSGSVHARAEGELRRAARERQGDSAERQARQNRQTISRLITSTAPGTDSRSDPVVTDRVIKYAASAAGIGVVGSGIAFFGVTQLLAFALQPVFLATAVFAGLSTYLTGALLDRNRSTSTSFVAEVEDESHGLVSVHVEYDGDGPPVVPGQLAMWRFVSPGMRSYPVEGYLTSSPADGIYRLTFALDEESADALRLVPEGTKVELKTILEADPFEYGDASLILVAGAGIALARGLLESLPGDVTMIYRTDSREDLLFVDELRAIAAERGAELRFSTGPDSAFPPKARPLCAQHLATVVEGIEERDVFVAGPKDMVRHAARSLRQLGIANDRVHAQVF